MLPPEERLKDDLHHARWRVEFLLRLLDAHRQVPASMDEEWREKEQEYARRISEAQVELERLEQMPDSQRLRTALTRSPFGTTS